MGMVKTGISIEPTLIDRVDTLAKVLHISRSELFSQAVTSFLKDYENRQMLEQLNAVYDGGAGDEEKLITKGFHQLHSMTADHKR